MAGCCRGDPQNEGGRCCPCEGKVQDCDCRFTANCAFTEVLGPSGIVSNCNPARLFMTTRELELVGPVNRRAAVRMTGDGIRTSVLADPPHPDIDHVGSWARFEAPSRPSYSAGLWQRSARYPRLRTGMYAVEQLGPTGADRQQTLRLGTFDAFGEWTGGVRVEATEANGLTVGVNTDRFRIFSGQGSGQIEAPSAALPTDERLQKVIDALTAFGFFRE